MKINHSFQINSLLKMIPPHFLENYFAEVKIKNDHKSFLERIDLTELEWSVAGTTTLDREWIVNV